MEKKKKAIKKPKIQEAEKPKAPEQYFMGIGRRKTAIAKVKLRLLGNGEFIVNNRAFQNYFPIFSLQKTSIEPLAIAGLLKKVNIQAHLQGGGISAQAQATSLAIARALVKTNPELKTVLKKQGLLTRDSRKKERKKPGLKRARRAPQWQKR